MLRAVFKQLLNKAASGDSRATAIFLGALKLYKPEITVGSLLSPDGSKDNSGAVSFSPTKPLNFDKQAVGTTSPAQKVTLTNTGKTQLNISAMKVAGQFAMTSICSKAITPNKSCTISVTFSPKSQGAKSGTITINDSASSKPQVIELSGTGT